MDLVEPLRLCPHRRYLLYRHPDGSTWCFCELTADPADEHLNARLATRQAEWDELGRLKEERRG